MSHIWACGRVSLVTNMLRRQSGRPSFHMLVLEVRVVFRGDDGGHAVLLPRA